MFELIGALITAVLTGWIVRRILGVPVGWPRTILLGLFLGGPGNGLLEYALTTLGLQPLSGEGPPSTGDSLVISLLFAWSLAFQAGVLTVLEVFIPTGSLPAPMDLIRGWPARIRRWRRYLRLLMIASKHGLGQFLQRGRGRPTGGRTNHELVARRVRHAFTDAGVTFVKLGQTLAPEPI